MTLNSKPVAIGIDIGGTNIRVARVKDGAIEIQTATSSTGESSELIGRCKSLIKEVINPDVTGIGIGIPARVDSKNRKIFPGGFVDLSDIDFCKEIEDMTGVEVVVENDATMALIGEVAYGAAKDCQSVVLLTIGTGIGGAILDQGKIVRGRAIAGQLGHIVVDPNGRKCLCGRSGCLETLSSGYALVEHLKSANLPESMRIEDLFQSKDASSNDIVRNWSNPLRLAIESITAILNPECVILGGGLGKSAYAAVKMFPDDDSWYSTKVIPATLGDNAGVIGAAHAARNNSTRAKRVVLVNGIPASGKSHLAKSLSSETGWPILATDTLKTPFYQEFEPVDRQLNRKLGRACLQAIFDIIEESPSDSTFIVDVWCGFQPIESLTDGISRSGITSIAEIWCHAPVDVVVDRYKSRIDSRNRNHPGEEYLPELRELGLVAESTGIAPCFKVDTTQKIDIAKLLVWLQKTL